VLVEVLFSLGTVGRRVEEEKSFDLDVPLQGCFLKDEHGLVDVGARKLLCDEDGDASCLVVDRAGDVDAAAAVTAVAGGV